MKLHKYINKQGKVIPQTYTDSKGKFYIEKGTIGWNIYKADYSYITSCETLKDVRETLDYYTEIE